MVVVNFGWLHFWDSLDTECLRGIHIYSQLCAWALHSLLCLSSLHTQTTMYAHGLKKPRTEFQPGWHFDIQTTRNAMQSKNLDNQEESKMHPHVIINFILGSSLYYEDTKSFLGLHFSPFKVWVSATLTCPCKSSMQITMAAIKETHQKCRTVNCDSRWASA